MSERDGIDTINLLRQHIEYYRDHELYQKKQKLFVQDDHVFDVVCFVIFFNILVIFCFCFSKISIYLKLLAIVFDIVLSFVSLHLRDKGSCKRYQIVKRQLEERQEYAPNIIRSLKINKLSNLCVANQKDAKVINNTFSNMLNFAFVNGQRSKVDHLVRRYKKMPLLAYQIKKAKKNGERKHQYSDYIDEYTDLLNAFKHELYLICQPYVKSAYRDWVDKHLNGTN